MIGKIFFTKYQVIRCLGSGGQGSVYLVFDLRLKKYWAMKKISKSTKVTMMEAHVMKNLRHPDLPSIVDVIETQDDIYLIVDYMEGVNLEQLRRKKTFSDEMVIQWGIQLCDILKYLHSQKPQIIYSDLKPSNLILANDSHLKLIDFGIALAGSGRQSSGTKGYAAPEQYGQNGYADVRSDIYSLGKVLSILSCQKNKKLQQVVKRCMKEQPKKRYQNMTQVQRALLRCKANVWERIDLRHIRFQRMVVYMMLIFGIFLFRIGTNNQREQRYDAYMNQGISLEAKSLQKQEFSMKVIEIYEKAVEYNKEKEEAYIRILNYYMKMGQKKEGLDAVIRYVESDQYGAKKSRKLLSQIGVLYLQGDQEGTFFLPDYALAQKYFSMEKKPKKQEKRFLQLVRELNKESSSIDWKKVDSYLVEFREEAKEFDATLTLLEVYESHETYLKSYQNSYFMKEQFLKQLEGQVSSDLQKQSYQEMIIKKKKVELYEGKANWESCIRDYEEVLESNQKKEAVWIRAAKYYEEKKRSEKAEKIYQKLIQTYPKEKDAYIYYGLLLYRKGKIQEAKRMYEKAKQLGGTTQYDYKALEEKLGGFNEKS